MSMSASLLKRAIELFREGNKAEANRLLKAVVEQEPSNQIAWNWYIETLSDPHERIGALQDYLLIYPDSQQAAKALQALKAQQGIVGEPVVQTRRPIPVQQIEPSRAASPRATAPRNDTPITSTQARLQPAAAATPRRNTSYASILTLFSILLLAALLVYTVRMQRDRDALQGHFDSLQTSYTDLQVAHEVTVQEKSQLKTQLDDLWVDYDYLNTVYNGLAQAYTDLESRFNELATKYLDLDSQHQALIQENDALKGKFSDMKSNYNELTGEYDTLKANYANLYGWYEWLQSNAIKPPYIAIHNRQVTLGFYGPYGNVETWTKDVSELENAILVGEYHRNNPAYVYYKLNGEEIIKQDYSSFIDAYPFKEYIRNLYQRSGSDYQFIQNVRQIISQLTIYNTETYQTPRHPLETFLLGGGDCEDTSILLASMLLAAPVDWDIQLAFMDVDHPQNPQIYNHVIVYVDTGSEKYLIESTNPNTFWPFDIRVGYLDVSK